MGTEFFTGQSNHTIIDHQFARLSEGCKYLKTRNVNNNIITYCTEKNGKNTKKMKSYVVSHQPHIRMCRTPLNPS